MADSAERGLMLWDGKSTGNPNNGALRELLAQGDSYRFKRIVSELHVNVLQ